KPKGDKPDKLQTYTTIEGEGAEVEKGQSVAVKYSGWLWDDTSKTFDSNWTEDGQPFAVDPVGEAQVIDGWNEGLVGQKVGSQIVLVVPPDKGYGEQGSEPSIPGDATLIFVIDILSAQGSGSGREPDQRLPRRHHEQAESCGRLPRRRSAHRARHRR